ncbi:phosphate transport system protein [Glaciecola punicea ACAM 611]|jgi:phosphate transport system protein|uniref:Phosphate-specific transport system accessory protein PhoU n=1 Tax=Glaciecola punicea ACAM 611 TaxID=1121923 RepID=H5TDJ9_9ALTE|nr:phosphate signaling complex protein PhoU [Glaciecola punicea]OFA32412.1 phosphate transport system regulatory protein PhoU [Glaciecola punicea]GAB56376.1 phosphate transport system protein [Glaciecola punicea ACAM 611]
MRRQIQLNTHISAKYNQELENLKHSVLTMGGVLEQQLVNTLVALKENAPSLAERVALNDSRIDSMESQVEQECMRIIAKRNPTAGDLRLVMTVSKTATDLERIGDEIARVAKLVTKDRIPASDIVLSGMMDIGNRNVAMMRATFDAFARQDDKAAVIAHKLDTQIDKVYKKIIEQTAAEIQSNPQDIAIWMDVLWAIRSFERIGDRCKNICEYVIYLTYGRDLHSSSMKKTVKKLLK